MGLFYKCKRKELVLWWSTPMKLIFGGKINRRGSEDPSTDPIYLKKKSLRKFLGRGPIGFRKNFLSQIYFLCTFVMGSKLNMLIIKRKTQHKN